MKAKTAIGMVMLLIGIGAAESASLIIPALLIGAGAYLVRDCFTN